MIGRMDFMPRRLQGIDHRNMKLTDMRTHRCAVQNLHFTCFRFINYLTTTVSKTQNEGIAYSISLFYYKTTLKTIAVFIKRLFIFYAHGAAFSLAKSDVLCYHLL